METEDRATEAEHHPRKYMTTDRSGNELVYRFSCCGERHAFGSRRGRDTFAENHEQEHEELMATIAREKRKRAQS